MAIVLHDVALKGELVEEEIHQHSAWYGKLPGLFAQDLLRGHPAGTYLLRDGEIEHQYYVSFVDMKGVVQHTPFQIHPETGWMMPNGESCFLKATQSVKDVIPLLIGSNEAQPFQVPV